MTTDSLLTNLRKKDVFYVDQVETDGTVSILKKPQFLGVMQKDIMNVQSSRGTAQAFIIDGKILQKSLSLLGKDASWVKNVLLQHNISRISDVFFAQIDQVGNIYIDLRDDLM